jgi:hypothetical protein
MLSAVSLAVILPTAFLLFVIAVAYLLLIVLYATNTFLLIRLPKFIT